MAVQNTVLEVTGLTKEYKRGPGGFNAVDHANLTVSKGSFVSIIGRSGSGKSTFLNMVAGLMRPTSGVVTIEGRNIFSLNDGDSSLLRNARIGYVPQGQSLLSGLTALDNVRLPFYLFKREGSNTAKAMALLDTVGIGHLAKSYPRQLSGGELRRVSIARALINDPALLIADEPTGDLDIDTTLEIMKLFSRIVQTGTAILLVTHELDTIGYGQSVYEMAAGVLREKSFPGYVTSAHIRFPD
ncbi:ABC transporter ATP-binding protein [Treponema primitia]|uniref:ABC transporter ATP-binding protein n=1 Tax=Treponema primitia TaxID=88058 RepID=UPI0002555821|nr:ABC transporter ATP-binding protein [Treponema primitia]